MILNYDLDISKNVESYFAILNYAAEYAEHVYVGMNLKNRLTMW